MPPLRLTNRPHSCSHQQELTSNYKDFQRDTCHKESSEVPTPVSTSINITVLLDVMPCDVAD